MTTFEEYKIYLLAKNDFKNSTEINKAITKKLLKTDGGFCYYFCQKHGVCFPELPILFDMFAKSKVKAKIFGFWFKPGDTKARYEKLLIAIKKCEKLIKNEQFSKTRTAP